uniref:Uncharacterized protein n=1 Tax=Leersia perrieri TaxID=77586 RepID=A0A0D9XK67_9ORYZ
MIDGVNDAVINQKSSEDTLKKLKLVHTVISTILVYAESNDKMRENILDMFLASSASDITTKYCSEEALSILASRSSIFIDLVGKKGVLSSCQQSYANRVCCFHKQRSLGISEVKCINWSLSLMAFINSQNVEIAEVILNWEKAIRRSLRVWRNAQSTNCSILFTSNQIVLYLFFKTFSHRIHGAWYDRLVIRNLICSMVCVSVQPLDGKEPKRKIRRYEIGG